MKPIVFCVWWLSLNDFLLAAAMESWNFLSTFSVSISEVSNSHSVLSKSCFHNLQFVFNFFYEVVLEVLEARLAGYVFYSVVVEVLRYSLMFGNAKIMYLWSEKLSCSLHFHVCSNIIIVLSATVRSTLLVPLADSNVVRALFSLAIFSRLLIRNSSKILPLLLVIASYQAVDLALCVHSQ